MSSDDNKRNPANEGKKEVADIGLIGLAVMGENLILNMANHGFKVVAFNRTVSKVDDFTNGRAKGKSIFGAHSEKELVDLLKKPRRIMIMVRAGDPVDQTINKLVPLLEKGDIIIDGGNSNYKDTNRRIEELEKKGLLFFGAGVSGGEEGALNGPSIMPGGSKAAWEHLKPIFQGIAAKVEDGTPCCDYVGEGGAGHFVKTVHNGIEYGDMQLISECVFLMKNYLGMDNEEMAKEFEEWNKGVLDSYLIQITKDILRYKDQETGKYLVDLIQDTAEQKGTGKWTVEVALDIGAPITLITEAVFARMISSQKEYREAASKVLPAPEGEAKFTGDKKAFLNDLRDTLYASKIISYTQGFVLIREAAKQFKWNLNYGAIALMWRGGCIIRSKFLGKIKEAFDNNKDLSNLLLDNFFKEQIGKAQTGWRRVAACSLTHGFPTPCIASAVTYYDGLRTARGPANLIQAQRDYFGAHTYERVDKPKKEYFHTNWTGHGGTTASTVYH